MMELASRFAYRSCISGSLAVGIEFVICASLDIVYLLCHLPTPYPGCEESNRR
jgi:hypothetical protein